MRSRYSHWAVLTTLFGGIAGLVAQQGDSRWCMTCRNPGEWGRPGPARNPDATMCEPPAWGCDPWASASPSPVGKPEDATVSFTTLAAPRGARKAYGRAVREFRKKNPDHDKIVEELEKATTLYPSYAAAWHLLGETRLILDQLDSARQAFERAVAEDPKFTHPYVALALVELKLGRPADAAQVADTVLRMNPYLAEAHYYRAVAYYTLGKLDAAKKSIRAIVQSGEEQAYPRIHFMLGDLRAGEGDVDGAAAEFRRLVELEPGSKAADLARKQLVRWDAEGVIEKP